MNSKSRIIIHEIGCPSCKGCSAKNLGRIPSADFYAGIHLDKIIPGGNLFRCPACNLYFRFPIQAIKYSDALYRDAKPTHWLYKDGIRRDWILVENLLKGCVGKKILDVGCWDGNFLMNLMGKWEKYGIEINHEAAARAKAGGIKIIGKNVNQLHNYQKDYFDVVTAFDIIEHMENPRVFLEELIEYTRPGGYILIGTGNTDVWTWMLAKSRYYYCWFPEHLSFVNRQWFELIKNKMHFEICDIKIFSHHHQPSLKGLILQSITNMLYLYVPSFFYKIRLLRWKFLGESEKQIYNHPPVWNMSRDHLFVVLRKLSSDTISDSQRYG